MTPTGIYIRDPEVEVIRRTKISAALSGRHYGKSELSKQGYIWVYSPTNPRADNHGYVKRCILVAEQFIGRLLTLKETVHHINKVKDDDRPENLWIFPSESEHKRHHVLAGDNIKPGHGSKVEDWTPERRQQHSEACKRGMTGKSEWTPEHRAKQSEITKKWWASRRSDNAIKSDTT